VVVRSNVLQQASKGTKAYDGNIKALTRCGHGTNFFTIRYEDIIVARFFFPDQAEKGKNSFLDRDNSSIYRIPCKM
jgi:hypothetical protein